MRTPILYKLSLAFTVTVLALALVVAGFEIAYRVDDRANGVTTADYLPRSDAEAGRTMYVPHPFLGYVMRPGHVRSTEDGEWLWTVNADGMRGERLVVPKPEGTYRILCVGGSTTFGTGCQRDEDAFPQKLQDMLRERLPAGVRVDVGNCGVPGYSTAETLINLALRLDRFDPDLVIVYHAANDALLVQAEGFRADYSHGRQVWSPFRVSPSERRLIETSRIYARLAGTRDAESSRNLRDLIQTEDFDERHVPANERLNLAGVAVFLRNMRSIVDVVRGQGREVLLQTFATDEAQDRRPNIRYHETIDAMNAGLVELAAERDVPLVDVAGHLDDRSKLFVDWMHLNEGGSALHAMILTEAVLPLIQP